MKFDTRQCFRILSCPPPSTADKKQARVDHGGRGARRSATINTHTNLGIYTYIYIYVHTHTHTHIYIYIYIGSHPPMIHPSLLAICSSTVLCFPMLSPRPRNHRHLQCFLHSTHTDLYLLCLFVVCVNHPKPKPESGSASATRKKHWGIAEVTNDTGNLDCFCVVGVVLTFIRNSLFIHKEAEEGS